MLHILNKGDTVAHHEIQALSGRLTIAVYRLDGQLISTLTQPNLITNAGKKFVAGLFIGSTENKAELKIAVGDSSTSAQASDTKLGNQLDVEKANASAINLVNVDGAERASIKLSVNLPALTAGKTQVLREAGILMVFPNSAEPVLYNHVNFADITRTDSVQMTLTWEVLF